MCRAWQAPLRLDILGENCRQGGCRCPLRVKTSNEQGCSCEGFWEFEEPDLGGACKARSLILNFVLRVLKATDFIFSRLPSKICILIITLCMKNVLEEGNSRSREARQSVGTTMKCIPNFHDLSSSSLHSVMKWGDANGTGGGWV